MPTPSLVPAACSAQSYAFFQQFIYSRSGIVLDEDKHYLLESRLLPILRELEIGSLDELTHRLSKNPPAALAQRVIEAMTTHETLFFRNPALFEALRRKVLPELLERREERRKVRIWSAAASSGQEAYSLAMMLVEMGSSPAEVEILGTDLSAQVLERARQGVYLPFEVKRGLSPACLNRHFTHNGLQWQLKDEVRRRVRFQQLDLRCDFRFLGVFDLILCRNVLIYFDLPTKSQILDRIHGMLLPGAKLVLGHAETVLNLHPGFERTPINNVTLYSAGVRAESPAHPGESNGYQP
jgi:chemotaxis protein methyltransferase CheR